jgi:hypothetical protein
VASPGVAVRDARGRLDAESHPAAELSNPGVQPAGSRSGCTSTRDFTQ